MFCTIAVLFSDVRELTLIFVHMFGALYQTAKPKSLTLLYLACDDVFQRHLWQFLRCSTCDTSLHLANPIHITYSSVLFIHVTFTKLILSFGSLPWWLHVIYRLSLCVGTVIHMFYIWRPEIKRSIRHEPWIRPRSFKHISCYLIALISYICGLKADVKNQWRNIAVQALYTSNEGLITSIFNVYLAD